MTREVLFKAVSIAGKWVEGDLVHNMRTNGNSLNKAPVAISKSDWFYPTEVHPDTVCQFTGLIDSSGKKIFEGDIVEKSGGNLNERYYCYSDEHQVGQKYVVYALESGFTLIKLERHLSIKDESIKIPNVIGNINNYNFWNGASTGCNVIGNIHNDKLKGE